MDDFGLSNAPGISQRIGQVAAMCGAALVGAAPLPIGLADVNVRRHTLYHQRTIDASLQQTFFNVVQTKYTTNMKQAAQLQNDNIFWCTAVRFAVLWDSTANDTQTPAQLEGLRQVVEWPEITFKVGDREVIQQVRGLQNFPAGSGLDIGIAAGVPITPAASGTYVGKINNGVPFKDNRADFVPFPIVPQKPISLLLDYSAAPNAKLTGYTTNGVSGSVAVYAYLDGIMISPANY